MGQAWTPATNEKTPYVGQLNYQYGINNYLTGLGGSIISEDYNAVALGGALSTYIGGVSFDYTYANSQFSSGEVANGDSLRLVYSTLIAPTNTNITLSSYRYSSEGFWSFNEFLANDNRDFDVTDRASKIDRFLGAKQKGRFDISLRQRLAPGYGNFFVSGSTRNFWNREGTDTQYQISYNNRFKELSYDLSATRVTNQDNRQYNEYRLNFTLPIFPSDSGARNYVSASAWKNTESGSQSQVQLGGIAGSDQQFTYGVSTTQGLDSRNTQKSYGLNGAYQGSLATLTGGLSEGQNYRQASLGISGAVLAHSEGVTFGQTLGETVALIEAKDAGGARITNSSGAALDSSGFGIVPYLSPYSRNRIELDPEGLSSDLELKTTSIESVPVAGSIVKIKFDTSKQNTVIINGHFADGKPLPFGAEVLNNTTQSLVGYVGQAGSIFARGVEDEGELLVKLKDRNCLMRYHANSSVSDKGVVSASPSLNKTDAVCKF